jgi:predicted DNA-binding transcriptional regulator AlpA
MAQVASEFGKKKDDLGVRQAAKELGVSLPSFYNYVAGTDLPRMEVLRKAYKKWGIRWIHIDSSQFVSTMKLASAEQYAIPFLDAVQEKDVKVSKIEREGANVLRVALKIRFSA